MDFVSLEQEVGGWGHGGHRHDLAILESSRPVGQDASDSHSLPRSDARL